MEIGYRIAYGDQQTFLYGQFRLMLPEGTVNVQILNANGQVVMSRKVDGDNMLDMSMALANGLYFVKSFRHDGSFDTEKLIINR